MELASKFGISYGEGKREIKGDPLYVRAACEASLKRLDVDCIDLYYQHRIDTRVPIEITVSHSYLLSNGMDISVSLGCVQTNSDEKYRFLGRCCLLIH